MVPVTQMFINSTTSKEGPRAPLSTHRLTITVPSKVGPTKPPPLFTLATTKSQDPGSLLSPQTLIPFSLLHSLLSRCPSPNRPLRPLGLQLPSASNPRSSPSFVNSPVTLLLRWTPGSPLRIWTPIGPGGGRGVLPTPH